MFVQNNSISTAFTSVHFGVETEANDFRFVRKVMGQSPGKLPGSVQLQRGEPKPTGCTESSRGGAVNFALDAPGRGSAWLYLQLPHDHEGISALGVSSGGEAYLQMET
eukprot:g26205.t1